MPDKNETEPEGTLTEEALAVAKELAEQPEPEDDTDKVMKKIFKEILEKPEAGKPFEIQTCEYVNPAGAPHLTVCIAVGRCGDIRISVSDKDAKDALGQVMDPVS